MACRITGRDAFRGWKGRVCCSFGRCVVFVFVCCCVVRLVWLFFGFFLWKFCIQLGFTEISSQSTCSLGNAGRKKHHLSTTESSYFFMTQLHGFSPKEKECKQIKQLEPRETAWNEQKQQQAAICKLEPLKCSLADVVKHSLDCWTNSKTSKWLVAHPVTPLKEEKILFWKDSTCTEAHFRAAYSGTTDCVSVFPLFGRLSHGGLAVPRYLLEKNFWENLSVGSLHAFVSCFTWFHKVLGWLSCLALFNQQACVRPWCFTGRPRPLGTDS